MKDDQLLRHVETFGFFDMPYGFILNLDPNQVRYKSMTGFGKINHLTPQIFMAKIMRCTVQVNLIVSTE